MLTRTLRRVAAVLCVVAPFVAQAGPHRSLFVAPDGAPDLSRDFARPSAIDALDPAPPQTLATEDLGDGPFLVRPFAGMLGATLSGVPTAPLGHVVDSDGASPLDAPVSGRDVHRATRAEPTLARRAALVVGVPEPSEMALIFIGLFAIVWLARRTAARARRRRSAA